MSMRLLHVSDTHVGFTAYHRLNEQGLNQREADFFGAFARAVDVAVAERVDAVVHSGDLFDSVRPTNRAIAHVLAQARRLAQAGIPFVVVSGNHEAPRLRETGAVLRLLEFVPGAHPVYKGRTETIRLGDLAVHATPHATSNPALAEEVARVRPDPEARYNVATLHAGILGVGDFRTGEFNEQTLAQNQLPQGMDYVALGHYHRATRLADGIWYAGSTERCTFREAKEEKSVNLVDLETGRVEPRILPTRPMRTLPPLGLEGVAEADMAPAIYRRLQEAPLEGAIARLAVTGIPQHVYATLDFHRLKQLTASALHFAWGWDIVRGQATTVASEASLDLPGAFVDYVRDKPLEGIDRDALVARARVLLAAAESGEAEP